MLSLYFSERPNCLGKFVAATEFPGSVVIVAGVESIARVASIASVLSVELRHQIIVKWIFVVHWDVCGLRILTCSTEES